MQQHFMKINRFDEMEVTIILSSVGANVRRSELYFICVGVKGRRIGKDLNGGGDKGHHRYCCSTL